MRKLTTNAVAMLLALVGCMGCGNRSASSVDNLIRVDVMADYPEKELILQDLMDVEYIALETTDDFITKGAVKAIGKDIMLVTNRGSDGDILVFDKNGKGLRKINRLGQSGEEYTQLTGLVLDEDNDEIFVKDNPARKIGVYDLLGNYKRSFKFTDTSYYNYIFNYDRDHLICYKSYPSEKGKRECHLIISKQDGRITHEIQIPSKGIETPVVTEGEFVITPEFYLTFPDRDKWILVNTSSDTIFHYLPDGNLSPFIVRSPSISSMDTKVFLFPTVITDRYCFMRTMRKEVDFTTFKGFLGEFVITPEFYLTFPDRDKWILVNTSSDTIFHYLPDGNLSPFIVRSPSISSMDTKVFLFPTVITDRYCFMRTMRKEVDFTTFKGFLGEDLVYDKQENALFSYILYNDDFINKEEVSLTSEPRNPEIAICQTLDAPDLVEAYEKGQLKGKLKEIAANLDEESNPVVMLLKKKK